MAKVSRLVVDAMLKEAADAINRNTQMMATVDRDGQGLVLELDDPPHAQLHLVLAGSA